MAISTCARGRIFEIASSARIRIATFNFENLDLPPKAHVSLEVRGEILRLALAKLDEYGHENGENLAPHGLAVPLSPSSTDWSNWPM